MKIIRVFILAIFVLSFTAAASAQARAENFSAVAMGGKTVELAKLKGRVVILVFWSTRCSICHSERPRLNELVAKHSGRKVAFLAATMEQENQVKSYLRKNRFDFQILPNSFGILLKYAKRDSEGRVSMGFPSYFVIDQAGNIRHKSSGWDKIEALGFAIDKALANR